MCGKNTQHLRSGELRIKSKMDKPKTEANNITQIECGKYFSNKAKLKRNTVQGITGFLHYLHKPISRAQILKNQARFPLLGLVLVQSFHRPLARLRLIVALPLVVLIRLRKPCVRASDFLDLFLFVWQRAYFLALTTNPRLFCDAIPIPEFKSKPRDDPVI